MPAPARLSWEESAALTRLVIGYCLGRGLLGRPGNSYSLIIHHPFEHEEYALYQWKRLKQFMPKAPEPSFVGSYNPESRPGAGNWRIRVGSKWFETAYKLLYPEGNFQITSSALELIGAEGIGALWADRGRIFPSKRSRGLIGHLHLHRYSWESAQLVHDWIYTLTGATGRIGHSPSAQERPMIRYSPKDVAKLIRAISHTWMAQARCLRDQFHTEEMVRITDEDPGWTAPPGPPPVEERRMRRSHVVPQLDPDAWLEEPPLIASERTARVLEPPAIPLRRP
jgi:hypothetical protein